MKTIIRSGMTMVSTVRRSSGAVVRWESAVFTGGVVGPGLEAERRRVSTTWPEAQATHAELVGLWTEAVEHAEKMLGTD